MLDEHICEEPRQTEEELSEILRIRRDKLKQLQDEGVTKFVEPFESLLATLEAKCGELVGALV